MNGPKSSGVPSRLDDDRSGRPVSRHYDDTQLVFLGHSAARDIRCWATSSTAYGMLHVGRHRRGSDSETIRNVWPLHQSFPGREAVDGTHVYEVGEAGRLWSDDGEREVARRRFTRRRFTRASSLPTTTTCSSSNSYGRDKNRVAASVLV
ncbi:uncharacterized protein LY79DRAFT_217976 [Colletotrichum navitas]|uniref:Uncharacterized protein n=1 Tax=Colletotrichum navitas TaxID=681940 RepID=A0AAD8Q0E6_9PEZI|nr:uncharacterized protein LY79DRAFT_217976 [Colletotrichum navitas]KAK1590427.1 hypothetical protein LY79DRAFT_217976 [Colletotrichum navitas]